MKKKYSLADIQKITFKLKEPTVIFLRGDLGSGKTTLSKHILKNILGVQEQVTSPTYTYYNKYGKNFHFDLYRLKDYDEFFAIGGEEILDNNEGVILIEWPEILGNYYVPDIEIILDKTTVDNEREIEILKNGK